MNRKLRLFAEIIAVLAILLSSCVKDSQPGKDDNTEVGPGGDDNGGDNGGDDNGGDDNGGGDNGGDNGDNTGGDSGDNGDGDNTGGDNGDGGNTGGDNPVESTCIHPWFELPAVDYEKSGKYLVSKSDETLYFAHHYCAGGEKGPDGKVARNYTVCYSSKYHCPVWVAAPRHKMYETKGTERTNAYAKDPSIPSDIQYNSKSTGGGCNKGHMLGSAERICSRKTNEQVFYYTNIAPQYSSTFNTGGGGWNILEDWVDSQVCSDTLYVVIGTYFEKYTDKRGTTASPDVISYGGRDDVAVPTMFYYLLLRTKSGKTGKSIKNCTREELKCAAFVRSHKTGKNVYVGAKDMMSVSDLEKITGFTYFTNVPQLDKTQCKPSDWGL